MKRATFDLGLRKLFVRKFITHKLKLDPSPFREMILRTVNRCFMPFLFYIAVNFSFNLILQKKRATEMFIHIN